MIVLTLVWQSTQQECTSETDEMPVDIVRSLIGTEKILGVSAKTVDRGLEAEEAGADYLPGPVPFSRQKQKTLL